MHPASLPVATAFAMLAAAAGATLPASDPPSGILGFYAVAESVIAHPPEAAALRVACTRRVKGDETHVGATGWFTLLAPADGPAIIAAFTLAELRKPGDAISTTVRFGPLPTAKVTARSSLDWAYVWDRNGDGRVDYAAYLQNAHPVLPDTVPADWPRPEVHPDGRVTVTMALLERMLDHAQMVFRHYADDDFDGTVDAVVVERFSEAWPMFVGDRVVARRAPGEDRASVAWAFRRAITDSSRTLAPDADGVLRIPSIATVPGTAPLKGAGRPAMPGTESADERLQHGTRVLRAVDALASRCGPAGRVQVP